MFQEYFLICQNKYYQLVFLLSKVLVWLLVMSFDFT